MDFASVRSSLSKIYLLGLGQTQIRPTLYPPYHTPSFSPLILNELRPYEKIKKLKKNIVGPK